MTRQHDKLDGIGFSVAAYVLLLLVAGSIVVVPALWLSAPTRYEAAAYVPPPQTRLLPPHSTRADVFQPAETDGAGGDPTLSALAKAYSRTPEQPPPAAARRSGEQPSRAAEPEPAPPQRTFTAPVTTF